jgi:hypothetical protein
MLSFCLLFVLLSYNSIYGQEEVSNDHTITLSTYVDGYYAGYNTDGDPNSFRPYITVGARGNSIGVNVAQMGVNYAHKNIRSNIVLHYGDIPQATWSSNYNHIQEGNVGIKLADGVWFDAGAFATHIGTESFLPKNNMLSSTAFKTYNEPFYQTGAKLTYDKPDNLELQFWILNGYNSFVDNNKSKSVGFLLSYSLSDITSITYTNLLGREDETGSDDNQNRFYQNVYVNTSWQDKVFVTAGFDMGTQTNSNLQNPNDAALMYAGLVTARYQFNPKWSLTARGEVFNDKNGFISGLVVNTDNEVAGLELFGFTIGTECRPAENAYFRAETRFTNAPEYLDIFRADNASQNTRMELLLTMGLELEKIFKM